MPFITVAPIIDGGNVRFKPPEMTQFATMFVYHLIFIEPPGSTVAGSTESERVSGDMAVATEALNVEESFL